MPEDRRNKGRGEEKPDMPTRSICLTAKQDAFVEKIVKTGE
jgi:hypothetical protein